STPLEAIERHLSDADEMHKNYPSHVAWLFVDRWNSVNANYVNLIDDITKNNAGFQKKWFDKQLEFEQSLKAYYTDGQVTNRTALEKALNAFTAEAYKEYFSIIKNNK
ncbi:MAG: hypothetical protein HUJ90_03600, partial [Bacteroidales bacterium]|nr:hypothetical protein [Bacteroidales bacterium]